MSHTADLILTNPQYAEDGSVITKGYLNGLSGLVVLTDDNTFTEDNTFEKAVTIPETPIAATHAASKGYVDAGLSAKAASSHNHAAADVNSGTLAHERGGLEADVSAWTGIPIIEGGSTRQVKLGGDEGLHLKGFGKAFYDFTEDGGVIGSIDTGITIPADAIITRAWYSVLDALTSAGAATMALGFTGKTGAFKAATAFDHVDMAEGFHEAIQDGTVANFEEIGGTAVNVLFTIAGANLTAGAVDIIFEYYID